ncbi:MAG: oligosaccharide flippase family protein [Bacteroidota bacterium]
MAGETAIYGIGNIATRILNYLLLTPYLTVIFKNNEYGIHGIMYSFSAFLLVIFSYRMDTALFRFGVREEERQKVFGTASIAIMISTAIFLILFILNAGPIAKILTSASDTRFVIYFCIIIALDTLTILPFAKLRLENQAKRFVYIKLLNVVITIIGVLTMLSLLPKLIEKGYALEAYYNRAHLLDYVFLSNLIASFIVVLSLLPEYFKFKLTFDKALFKKMFRYAFPLIIVSLAAVINQLSDRLFINWLIGIDESGIYNAAVKIAILMSLFATAFNYAAEPFFFKNASKSENKDIYGQVGLAFTIVGSVVFLGILFYLDLIQYILGKDFRSGLDIVPVMLMAYLFLGLYYNFSIWYKLSDRTHIGAYIAIGGSIITILLNILLLPWLGYIGSSWASLSCFLFMCVAAYFLGQKYYPIQYPIAKIISYIVLAIAFYLFSNWIRPWAGENIYVILLMNTVLLLMYIGFVFFRERNGLIKAIR